MIILLVMMIASMSSSRSILIQEKMTGAVRENHLAFNAAEAVDVLTWGGNCVVVGVPSADAKLDVRITHLTHVDRGILGCRYGSAQPHRDIPRFVEDYRAGRLLLDELVTQIYPLEEFDAAVAALRAGELARGVLTRERNRVH